MNRLTIAIGVSGVFIVGAWTLLASASPPLSSARGDAQAAARSTPRSDGPRQAGDCPRGGRPGEILWTYTIPDNAGMVLGVPAVAADGTVYFAASHGSVYALDCRGKERWRFDYRDHVPDSEGIPVPNAALVIGGDGTIYVVPDHHSGSSPSVENLVIAIRPDGSMGWLHRGAELYHASLLISASPVIDTRGRLFAQRVAFGQLGLAGWIEVLDPYGRTIPGFPITSQAAAAAPVGLADDRVVFFGNAELELDDAPTPSPTPAATGAPPRPSTDPTRTRTPASPRPSPTRRPTATADVNEDSLAYLPWTGREVRADPVAVGGESKRRAGPAPSSDAWGRGHAPGAADAPALSRPAELRILTDVLAPGVPFSLGFAVLAAPSAFGDLVVFQIDESVATVGTVPPRLEGWSLATQPPRKVWEHGLRAGLVDAALLGGHDAARDRLELIYLDTSGLLVSLAVPTGPDTATPPTFNWARQVGDQAIFGAVLGDAGFVYVTVDNDKIVAIDRAAGGDGWSRELGEETVTTALTLAPGGVLYAGTLSGSLYAIATESVGLDPAAAWPAVRHDNQNTGRAGR